MKLSVIITHYNKLPLLEYLLTYFYRHQRNDVEIICIDDCSDRFELVDNNVLDNIVFIRNPENMGIGFVRQQGLELATGEYICYIDADDIITEEYLDTIMDGLYANNVDLLGFRAITYPWGELLRYNEVMVWNKVFRKQFLLDNNLYFTNERMGEDMVFTPQVYKCNPTIVYLNKVIYIYNQLFDSVSGSGCMPI